MQKRRKILRPAILAVVLFSSITLAETLSSQPSPKTQVIIVGTLHGLHFKADQYTAGVLREILMALHPDAILNELPLCQVDSNGRPLYKDPNKYPEGWAADTVATELKIRQIPFDRPDRQENFKKTRYFERSANYGKQQREWVQFVEENDPNSYELSILQVFKETCCAQAELSLHASPEVINSNSFDAIIRAKKTLQYDILGPIFAKYPKYKTLSDENHFFHDQWLIRNRIMADNVVKAVKQYPGKRLVVVTGLEHRYILRDLLKDEKGIELKEYWQVVKVDIQKILQADEAVKQHIKPSK